MENLETKNFGELIKKFGIKILASSLKGLLVLKKYLPKWLKKSNGPFKKIGWFFLLVFILPSYKLYLVLKKLINKFYAPQLIKHKFLHPFNRRYLIHLIVIFITILVIAANTNAYETRIEDIGETNILSQLLVEKEELDSIEEEGPIIKTKKITRYMEPGGVESKPITPEVEIGKEILPGTITGGSALVKPILSPAEAEIRQRDKIVSYTVQVGDSVSAIALKFGVSNYTILWENNLTAYSIIRPGDTLTILPVSGIRHKVAKGETLTKIIKKYSLETDDIDKVIEFNKLASAEDIKIGEKLIIPGGVKPTVTSSYSFRSWAAPSAITRGTGKMVWPTTCRQITRYFGWLHHGLDIACGYGPAIYATDSGTIIKAQGGWNGGYGIVVVVDHGNGVQTLYGHLSKLYVQVGQNVKRGQALGAMGSTGRSTGPHLHFEVRVSGVRKNPLYYI